MPDRKDSEKRRRRPLGCVSISMLLGIGIGHVYVTIRESNDSMTFVLALSIGAAVGLTVGLSLDIVDSWNWSKANAHSRPEDLKPNYWARAAFVTSLCSLLAPAFHYVTNLTAPPSEILVESVVLGLVCSAVGMGLSIVAAFLSKQYRNRLAAVAFDTSVAVGCFWVLALYVGRLLSSATH